jgi:hypothetical protein
MKGQDKGWGFIHERDANGHIVPHVNEESSGEGLSLFLTQQFQHELGIVGPYAGPTATTWLNTSLPTGDPHCTRFYTGDGSADPPDFGSRADYVNTVLPFPGNGPATGCSMLFLYYLFTQLGFSIEEIIANAPGYKSDGLTLNATGTLRGVYQNLTGDTGDPFPKFKEILAFHFPETSPATITGPNPDNPYPLTLPPP